jgi:hypothetical protein
MGRDARGAAHSRSETCRADRYAALSAQEPLGYGNCPECGNALVTAFGDGRFMCAENGHIVVLSAQEPAAQEDGA